jgi:hypothetical protein
MGLETQLKGYSHSGLQAIERFRCGSQCLLLRSRLCCLRRRMGQRNVKWVSRSLCYLSIHDRVNITETDSAHSIRTQEIKSDKEPMVIGMVGSNHSMKLCGTMLAPGKIEQGNHKYQALHDCGTLFCVIPNKGMNSPTDFFVKEVTNVSST